MRPSIGNRDFRADQSCFPYKTPKSNETLYGLGSRFKLHINLQFHLLLFDYPRKPSESSQQFYFITHSPPSIVEITIVTRQTRTQAKVRELYDSSTMVAKIVDDKRAYNRARHVS